MHLLPITHWVWGSGWLGQTGLLDFAGGTVVHITTGVDTPVAAALIIGILAGLVCCNAVIFIKQKLKIDDSLDIFPVHGVGGIYSYLIMVSIFTTDKI